jgi:hypothetical protein
MSKLSSVKSRIGRTSLKISSRDGAKPRKSARPKENVGCNSVFGYLIEAAHVQAAAAVDMHQYGTTKAAALSKTMRRQARAE